MKAQERTEILSEIALSELCTWKNSIEEIAKVEMIKEANIGLAMMRGRESIEGQVFNVGEVLVSEATLSIDGHIGYGVTLGNNLEKAEILAMLDAIYYSKDEKWAQLIEALDSWLGEQKAEQYKKKMKDFQLTKRSLVTFETMDEMERG